MRLPLHTHRDWNGLNCLITSRVKCNISRKREMKICFWGHKGAGLVIQGMRKWRFRLGAASVFSSTGQQRRNRIKQGRAAGRTLLLFHHWPGLTLLSDADMYFLLKLHSALNKWVSSESLSRMNQWTSLVSECRARFTWRRVSDYTHILHQSWGHLQLRRDWCTAPSFKAINCPPVTPKSHSSILELISFHKSLPSFQTLHTGWKVSSDPTHIKGKVLSFSVVLLEAELFPEGMALVVGSQSASYML